MSESNVAERLKLFIESQKISYSQFADKCGIPRPSLSQFITGRNKKISDTMVGQIHKEFPNLSIVWLLFGEGPMENSRVESEPEVAFPSPDDSFGSIFPELSLADEKFVGQNQNFLTNDTEQAKNSKENALNLPKNGIKSSNNEDSKLAKKLKELGAQLDNLKKNPRKVIQITVYYDDSTFETFLPSANAIRN
ncbi:MAG: helix-turn-helix transcriptional regulator [Muribaculaceae bacterium]|nr:helix-turn-helix transcriptional regulator [Muribaculaceae bacterium]